MVQHFKATGGARRQTHWAAYSNKARADWDADQRREASKLYLTGGYKKRVLQRTVTATHQEIQQAPAKVFLNHRGGGGG